jgi:4-diphosphocytidyl-2C-methyl-D-erythritol kinase
MSGSGSAVFALFGDKPELTLPTDIFVHVERI